MVELHPVCVSRYRCLAGFDSNVEKFANQKVHGFQFKRKIYIAYDLRERKNGFVRQKLTWTAGWSECAVSLRKPPRFPFVEEMNVGSIQVKTNLDRALTGKEWFYETEKARFEDYDEMAAFAFGWAAFVVLRKANAIPGRLTRTGCAKKAIEWLEEYREWKKAGFPADFVKVETPKKGVIESDG